MKADTSKYTILVISMGFLLLDILFSMPWARTISLITGIIGIISNSFSRAVEKGWMAISRVLSLIIPSILLGSVFYLILFPIALVSKIFTKDPLMLSNEYQTLFIPVRKDLDKKSFEKTW
jgi:phosphate/sulfate permease